MHITIWLAILLVMFFFNAHAAETSAPPANGTVAQGAEAGKNENTKNTDSAQSKEWVAPEPEFIYIIIGIIFLLTPFLGLILIQRALSDSKFSLADALSEEVTITSKDAAGNSAEITELRASSSRMIAFIGMLLILLMFMGFGIFSLYSFAKTGVMPETDNIINFLVAGLTLFAPYFVNQFASLFEKLAPKK
jgi:hypothetical protein